MKYSRKRSQAQLIALIIFIVLMLGTYFLFGDKLGMPEIPFLGDLFKSTEKVDKKPSKVDKDTEKKKEEKEQEKYKPVPKPEKDNNSRENSNNKNNSNKDSNNSLEKPSNKPITVSLLDIKKDKDLYEKNESIKLNLNIKIDETKSKASYIIINNKKYKLNESYQVIVDGFKNFGLYDLKISKIILDNNQEFNIASNIKIEVKKEMPSIDIDTNYMESEKKLVIDFNINDKDKSITGNSYIIIKNFKNVEISKQEIQNNNLVFSDIEPDQYYLEFVTDYSLATNLNKNNALISKKTINVQLKDYELKNIIDLKIYKNNNDNLIEVSDEEVITNGNKDNYYVEVISQYFPNKKDTKSFYTNIRKVENNHNELLLTLDIDGFIQYNDETSKNIKVPFPFTKQVIDNEENYIPNKKYLSSLKEYDNNRQLIYSNLYKLMPYYDSSYLISDGNKIALDNELNIKTIKDIIPYRNNMMVTGLSNDNYDKIDYILIVFDDDSKSKYDVNYYTFGHNIVTYFIPKLKTNYQYYNFVIDTTSESFKNYLSKIQNYNFEADIYPVGNTEYIARDKNMYFGIFKEFQKEAKNFLIKLASNNNIDFSNNYMADLLVKKQLTEETLKQMLYTYNYIYKWYDFDIAGINLGDIIFFDDSILKDSLDTFSFSKQIATKVEANYQNGNNTQNFYIKYLKSQTGFNTISDFLEYFIKYYADYKDVNDWIIDNFKGVIVEIPATYETNNTNYRVWDYMKQNQVLGAGSMLLPVLSLKSSDMYILSVPTQLCIGTMNNYGEYNANNPDTREVMRKKIINYGKQVAIFYDTTSRIINNGPVRLNNVRNLQVDRRIFGWELQEPDTTKDMVIKYVYGPLAISPANNGAGAYANGSGMFWVWSSLLNGYSTFTHETAHNQDGRIFLEGQGRRNGGFAEDYADGNITQGTGDGVINFNLSYNVNKNNAQTANLTIDRINSRDKIGDFYKKMFETINTMDYIEGKAFLKMPANIQYLVADTATYPNLTEDNLTNANARNITKYVSLSDDNFANMNLKTFEDLWDNQIVLRPGKANGNTIGINSYGGDSIYNVYWYQPHNDYGRPDSYTFKRTAFEMLGEGGYDGYVKYYSYKNPNDLVALRDVTGNENITWKSYKLSKYQEIENKNNVTSYYIQDEIINLFSDLFELDATDSNTYNNTYSTMLRNNFYHYLQRVTDDFRDSIYDYGNIIHIKNGSQFVSLMKENPNRAFVLDNDIDLSNYTGDQSITDVTFMGSLNGNGHSIIGAKQPIFTNILYSYIRNIVLTDADININNENVAILSKTANRSIFTNINMKNSKVTGNTRVAGLIGTATKSVLGQISSDIDIIIKQDRGGSLVAESEGSAIVNSYSRGNITQESNEYAGGWHVGGLVGRLSAGAGLNKTYSQTYINQKNTRIERAAGGLIGKIEGDHSVINSFSVSNGINLYRFEGHSNRNIYASGIYNNYEYNKSNGRTNQNLVSFDINGIINLITRTELQDVNFYLNTLGWDNKIWNFEQLNNGSLPTLFGNDQSDKIPFEDGIKEPDEVIIKEPDISIKEDEENMDEPQTNEPPISDEKDEDNTLEENNLKEQLHDDNKNNS